MENIMEGEMWMPILGFEGLYDISSMGRIRSLPKKLNNAITKQKILKGFLNNDGYVKVKLYKNDKKTNYFVHRLVGSHYLINAENKSQINHKDCNKRNNKLGNLEWCTHSENQKHAFANGLQIPNRLGKFGKDNFMSKMVLCITNNKIYESQSDAARDLNLYQGSISKVCLGEMNQTKGYRFKFI